MSKIVARMEKMKAGNLGGIQRHNQRETDNHSNKEIDVERSYLNYDIVNQESINDRKRIHEIIDEQRVSKRAVRKDAVLVDEWIITSDKTFFETADSRKFFEDSLAYFSDRCGSQKIAYATVHLDETTPHMHLGIVPMYNTRLSSKQMFTREALKEIQDELPTYLQQRGHAIERGIKGSEQKHLTVEEYKENQREVEKMATKIAELKIQAKAEIEKAISVAKDNAEGELTELERENKRKIAEEVRKTNDKLTELKAIVANVSNVYQLSEKLETLENKTDRSVFGKRMLKKEEFQDIKDTILAVKKESVLDAVDKHNALKRLEKLEEKNKNMSARLQREEAKNHTLQLEQKELHTKLRKSENDIQVYADMLIHDFNVTNISDSEYEARLILSNLEFNIEPEDEY
ncbi:MobV family relaxase, partial [Megasphaera stantonii]|uniref:MobV family relaxase n=1 Tax=Megasphaera stantonii TaxID=2144175 RepID=UPI0018E523C5